MPCLICGLCPRTTCAFSNAYFVFTLWRHFFVPFSFVSTVNDVIADKNVVTKIMNNFTGLQHIEFIGFSKRHWQTSYCPVAYGWCLGLC